MYIELSIPMAVMETGVKVTEKSLSVVLAMRHTKSAKCCEATPSLTVYIFSSKCTSTATTVGRNTVRCQVATYMSVLGFKLVPVGLGLGVFVGETIAVEVAVVVVAVEAVVLVVEVVVTVLVDVAVEVGVLVVVVLGAGTLVAVVKDTT